MPRKSSDLLKRRLKIAELVGQQGEIKVDDLSVLLGVSGVTIRGDLNYLEQQGYLKRSFGGAIAASTVASVPAQNDTTVASQSLSLAHKIEIARHGAQLITDGDTIFLGHGETCRRIIPLLCDKRQLRVIVNDLHHVLLAEQYIDGEIIIAGDEVIRTESLVAGKNFDEIIQRNKIDHCVLEVSLHPENNRLMINQPLLISHYQKCFDKALNVTAILNPSYDSVGGLPPLGELSDVNNVIACGVINEHYQQLLANADFTVHIHHNDCCTWSARNKSRE